MGSIDYIKLYNLQDKVMDILFDTERVFYLTGGTCLSRFYKEKRYSDDLDFFTHNSNDFYRATKEIKIALNEKFEIVEEVTAKDFIRFRVDDILQVDFVNDRVMRYKKTVELDNGYIIDNYENILANKFTAVMGRDNPKDIFDIFLIDKFYKYNCKDILNIAHQKAGFSNDELIIRLKTFPTTLLNQISLIDKSFLDNFDKEYKLFIKKIENLGEIK